jgi:hypothetical protein
MIRIVLVENHTPNSWVTNCEVEFENELSGLLSEVTENSFALNGRAITVVGSSLIDDSIVEAALGREIDSDDIAFDQLPGELTLVGLLPTDIVIEVKVTAEDVAIEIEDS